MIANVTLRCVVVDDDAVSRQIIEKYVEKADELELIASFDGAEDAVGLLTRGQADLVFLDVEMPNLNGMEFLRNLNVPARIVLTTVNEQYALEAFEHDVVDYLLKPVAYARFLKAVARAKALIEAESTQTTTDDLFVKFNSRYIKIPSADVVWIEAIGDYVEIHTSDKKYMAHTTMKALEKKLPPQDFIRVHRSYIVRMNSIVEIEDNTLVVGKKLVPIGKSYREKLIRSLNLI